MQFSTAIAAHTLSRPPLFALTLSLSLSLQLHSYGVVASVCEAAERMKSNSKQLTTVDLLNEYHTVVWLFVVRCICVFASGMFHWLFHFAILPQKHRALQTININCFNSNAKMCLVKSSNQSNSECKLCAKELQSIADIRLTANECGLHACRSIAQIVNNWF